MSLLDKFFKPVPNPTPEKPKPAMDELFGRTQVAYPENSFFAQADARKGGQAVRPSRDLARVLELPRRDRPDTTTLAEELTRKFGKGPVKCECRARWNRPCASALLPTQAWALQEIATVGGLFGPIGVGDGKTLIDLLAAMAMPDCRVAVLLIPPDLKYQLLEVDWPYYEQHWNLPNLTSGRWSIPGRPYLHVHSFSELSSAKSTDLLTRIGPDLVIVDEAQNLRNRTASRTKRFLRFFAEQDKAGKMLVRLVAMSGTMTEKSLKDYAHLTNLALGDKSPTPLHWPVVEEWASAIDKSDFPAPIGALSALCEPGEHLYSGWRRRLHQSPGVVASTNEANCNASLIISKRDVAVPKAVLDALLKLNQTWQRPDGEELVSALDKARCARELASGFYYHWIWPKNEPLDVRKTWLEVRAAWHKEVREKLKHSRPHMDSPLLVTKAAIRFQEKYKGDLPVWDSQYWPEWQQVRNTCHPETEAVWIDPFLAIDAAAWGKEHSGIIWYEHDTFGRKIADLSGLPFYGPGEEAAAGLIAEKGNRSVVASIRSHHKGKNLQIAFGHNLVANPPSTTSIWEQMLGRTHRRGQPRDEVRVDVYRHTPEIKQALDEARLRSAYVEGTMGGALKLLRATFILG